MAGSFGRITEGASFDRALELTLLLEDAGTLFGRWSIADS